MCIQQKPEQAYVLWATPAGVLHCAAGVLHS